MKYLLVLFTLFFGLNAYSQNVEIEGNILYKLPNGDLVQRDVLMSVPPRGEGIVTLSGNGFSWSTEDFGSYETNDKIVFWALFENDFMGRDSKILFRGSYMRGNNLIVYYGDMYKVNNDEESEEDFRYIGGFKFQFVR